MQGELRLAELVVDRDDVVVPERDAEARLLRGGALVRVGARARVRVGVGVGVAVGVGFGFGFGVRCRVGRARAHCGLPDI